MSIPFKLVAETGGAAILPHNRMMNRLTRTPIPHHSGLALIRYPNGADIRRFQARTRQSVAGDLELARPNLHRIMFHPTRLRENLLKLLFLHCADRTRLVKKNGSRT